MILIVSADAGPAQGGECAVLPTRYPSCGANANRLSGICEQSKFVHIDETHLSAARAQLISVSLEHGLRGHRAAVVGPASSPPWAPPIIGRMRYRFSPLATMGPCPSTDADPRKRCRFTAVLPKPFSRYQDQHQPQVLRSAGRRRCSERHPVGRCRRTVGSAGLAAP
jgi:hypothetical protein